MGTNKVASSDVHFARAESDAILAWQIENLAANSRKFFPESFCQPHDHRSSVLKRLGQFGFDASLTPSCGRADALNSLHRSNLALIVATWEFRSESFAV